MEIAKALKLLKKNPKSLLGVDISSSSVKILEISGVEGNLCVEGYGREAMPLNAIDGNVIKDIDAVAACIKRLFETSKLTSKMVALAVPDSSVITKIVQINDGLTDQEMEELIIIEADKYIPYPIDEINLDFEILGHSAKSTSMLDVLIVASRAENVNSRVEVISRAGLEAKIVDVESYAVERVAQLLANDLPETIKDKTLAVIDIGENYTHLFVLSGMKLIFTREEKFGGSQLIEATAEHYKITLEQAIEANKTGTVLENYESEVLEPFKELIILQIRRTLQFFYSTSHHSSVDHIVLAGGVARQTGLAALIQEQLAVPTSVANPLSHMSFSKKINLDNINNDAPALLVACGLALRNIG